ncbi:hypothetical protein CTI14_66090, partial [Methylobacterium radiotolerans]
MLNVYWKKRQAGPTRCARRNVSALFVESISPLLRELHGGTVDGVPPPGGSVGLMLNVYWKKRQAGPTRCA